MKKRLLFREFVVLMSILFVELMVISCGPAQVDTTSCEAVFKGDHKLMCANVDSTGDNCKYMVLAGSKVKFMFETNDTTYAGIYIPIEKLRVRFDESVSEPYIKFRWCSGQGMNAKVNLQNAVDEKVVYVLMICKKEDRNIDINLINQIHADVKE